MLEIARREPVVVFRVLDRAGRAIGEVVHPRATPIIKRGAETVLLVRRVEDTAAEAPA
jgi:hypothetical protein